MILESGFGQIMAKEIDEVPGVFLKLMRKSEQFQRAKKLVDDSNISSVQILARGTSDNAAYFLKYLIETSLGLPVGLSSPSSVSIYKTKLNFNGVLVIAISQSGQSPDLIQYVQAAKEAGSALISITNNSNSPLALSSDVHIDLFAGPEIAVAATKSYSAQVLASYLLVSAWSGALEKIDGLIEATQVALKIDLSQIVNDFATREQIVILGRGFSYANAREAALKIQETCKVPVQGMSTADYLHGPISALTPSTTVVLLAPYGIRKNSIDEAVIRIRDIGSKIIWIGNGYPLKGGEFAVGGSALENEVLSSIADTVLIQRLALLLSLREGLDPDHPKGLSKVTLTH